MTAENEVTNDIWLPRPWSGDGDLQSCSYDDVLSVSNFGGFAFHNVGGISSLGVRSANLLVSLLAGVVERKFLARYGSTHKSEMDALPGGDITFGYSAISSCESRKNATRMPYRAIRSAVVQALKKVVTDYANGGAARGYVDNFGKLYPDCPYTGEAIPYSTGIGKYYSVIDFMCAIGATNAGDVWSDITQRYYQYGCYSFACVLKLSDVKDFDGYERGSGFSPFLDSLLDDLCSLTGCSYSVNRWWEDHVYGTELDDGDDLMKCWADMVRNSDVYYECLFRDCAEIGSLSFNSWAVSATMAALMSFARYQRMRQNVAIGNVEHWKDNKIISFELDYEEAGCYTTWHVTRTSTCYRSSVSCSRKAAVGYDVSATCTGAALDGYATCYADAILMEYCGSKIHRYYRCSGYDRPYRSSGKGEWSYEMEGPGFSGYEVYGSTVDASRYFPKAFCEIPSASKNTIGLTYPAENFPNTKSESVSSRIVHLYNYLPVWKRYSGYDASPGSDKDGLAMFVVCGQIDESPWVADASFSLFSSVMNGEKDTMMAELGNLLEEDYNLVYYPGFDNALSDSYLGMGDSVARSIEQAMHGFDPTIVEPDKTSRADVIVHDEFTDAMGVTLQRWRVYNRFEGRDVLLDTITAHSETESVRIKIADYGRDKKSFYSPRENGIDSGALLDGISSKTYILFGGFFQIVEWDFQYLNRE